MQLLKYNIKESENVGMSIFCKSQRMNKNDEQDDIVRKNKHTYYFLI